MINDRGVMVAADPGHGQPNFELDRLASIPTRAELAAEAIRTAILRGELRQGQPLVERDVAQFLGVSKTPVREALKLLVRTGLIETRAYHGMTVTTVTEGMVKDLFRTRLRLEPYAVGEAYGARDAETLKLAHAALSEADEAATKGDLGAMVMANRRFHRAVYAGCDNSMLCGMLDNLQDRAALVAIAGWNREPTWFTDAAEHKAILAAFESDSFEQAEREMHRHIAQSADRVLASWRR
jgi:DNA-binding GntR family transcriptional regulator